MYEYFMLVSSELHVCLISMNEVSADALCEVLPVAPVNTVLWDVALYGLINRQRRSSKTFSADAHWFVCTIAGFAR